MGRLFFASRQRLETDMGAGLMHMAKKPRGGSDEKSLESEKDREELDKAENAPPPEDEEDRDEGEEYPDEEEGLDRPVPEEESRSEWSSGAEEDMDLIARFLEGDQKAFTSLVIKYQHKVHNLCFRVLGDKHEAQDMAQEVFLTVHKSLKNFRGDSMFSTWIFRVTVNHCKNRLKYLGRRNYFGSISMDQPQEIKDGEVYFEFEDESPSPEDIIGGQEIQTVVQAAIAELDEDHRVCIVLRDIQDLSYEEIAEVLKIKVGTVKSRIHRARMELKKILEEKMAVQTDS